MVAFYPIVIGAALVGFIGRWVALVLLGVPRLVEVLRIFRSPKPDVPPPGYPTWPLWFVGAAVVHTRGAGGLLIVGLILNALLPIRLPWVWPTRPGCREVAPTGALASPICNGGAADIGAARP